MGMALPPPELNADITSEILLRVVPDEIARLFRASLICKLWHRILSDPAFRRRYRNYHGLASLLGFFYNLDFPGPGFGFDFPEPSSRFVATMAASPLPQAAAAAAARYDGRRVSWALDCRHGRVLYAKDDSRGLAVWDPISDDWTDLPPPGIQYRSYCAAVICDVAGCDHRDCHGGRFLVVCIGGDASLTVYACVYSSEDGSWQSPVSDGTQSWGIDMTRPALIGDGIYCTVFTLVDGGSILKYDLVKRRFTWIFMPCSHRRDAVLMQNEDGSLGRASVRGSRLYLWSRTRNSADAGQRDAAGWVQRRVFKLRKLLALDERDCIQATAIGYAEGVGVLFIRTNAGVFRLELKSRRMVKMSDPSKNYPSVVPFISFFTPDCVSTFLESYHFTNPSSAVK